MFNADKFAESFAGAVRATSERSVQSFAAKGPIVGAEAIGEETFSLWTIYPATPVGAEAAVKKDWSGKWLYFAKSGSVPGARVRVFFNGGTQYVLMTPGSLVRGNFSGVALVNDAGNQDTTLYSLAVPTSPPADIVLPGALYGSARFVWGNDESLLYTETTGNDNSFAAPNFSQYTPAYNATAFNALNIPQAPTSGVDVSRCRGVRAYIYLATAAQTITAVTSFRWWVHSPTMAVYSKSLGVALAGWAPNNEIFPAPIATAGQTKWALADFEVGIRYGRVFLEVIGYTNTLGSIGNTRVILEAA